MVTGIIIFTVIVAIGAFAWAVMTGDSSQTDVDAGDVSLLATGIQDPTLGVTSYTVGKACQGCDLGECSGNLEKFTDTAVDLSTLNQTLADEGVTEELPVFTEDEPVIRATPQDVGTMVILEPKPSEKKEGGNPLG